MKKYLIAIALILLASTAWASPTWVSAPGWITSTDCSGTIATGAGCYNSSTKVLCIGNGTSCAGSYYVAAYLASTNAETAYFGALTSATLTATTVNTTVVNLTGNEPHYKSFACNTATMATAGTVGTGDACNVLSTVPTRILWVDGASASLVKPSGDSQIVTDIGSHTLTNKILTYPQIQSQETSITGATTLTAGLLYQGRFTNYAMSADSVVTLPTAAAGMDAVFIVATTTATWTINAAASNTIYTAGGGVATYGIKASSPSIGDYFTFFSFKTGTNTWKWIFASGRGTQATY